jgi:hypothetical protein
MYKLLGIDATEGKLTRLDLYFVVYSICTHSLESRCHSIFDIQHETFLFQSSVNFCMIDDDKDAACTIVHHALIGLFGPQNDIVDVRL